MTEERDVPGYYAVIPATVRYDNKLRPNAKILYGEISALATKKGYCWASNQYFMDLYGLGLRTVKDLISNLRQRGHIHVEYGKGSMRKIYLAEATPPDAVKGVPKMARGGAKNGTTPGAKNGTHNNKTSLTNKDTSRAWELKVIDLYHEILPELPILRNPEKSELGKQIQGQIRQRARQRKWKTSLEPWRKYFEYVKSTTLVDGYKGWIPDMEWLTRPRNMEKVESGKYRQRQQVRLGEAGRRGVEQDGLSEAEKRKFDDASK